MPERFGVRRTQADLKKSLRGASTHIIEQVGGVKEATEDVREAAKNKVEKLVVKATDPYEEVLAEYNAAFACMNDKGLSLLRQRERSADPIELSRCW